MRFMVIFRNGCQLYLEKMDPVAYRCGLLDYLDGLDQDEEKMNNDSCLELFEELEEIQKQDRRIRGQANRERLKIFCSGLLPFVRGFYKIVLPTGNNATI